MQHVQNEPPPLGDVRPDLPADLCAIVHKMMAKKPADRYQTARDSDPRPGEGAEGVAGRASQPTAIVGEPDVAGDPGAGDDARPASLARPPGRRRRVRADVYLSAAPRRGAGAVVSLGCPGRRPRAAVAAGGWWAFGRIPPAARAEAAAGRPRAAGRPPAGAGRLRPGAANCSAKREPLVDPDRAVRGGRRARPPVRPRAAARRRRPGVQGAGAGAAGRPAAKAPGGRLAGLAGRLGQAIVLAHRDKAKESNDLFERGLTGPPRVPTITPDKFLLAHPEFGQAVADALNRNAENLNAAEIVRTARMASDPGRIAPRPEVVECLRASVESWAWAYFDSGQTSSTSAGASDRRRESRRKSRSRRPASSEGVWRRSASTFPASPPSGVHWPGRAETSS